MRGTIRKRELPSGRVTWEFQLDAGKDADGKRQRITRGGFELKGQAEDELNRLLAEQQDGALVKPTPKTFEEYLNEWFREHAERHCAPKTVERYRQLADSYLLPKLGSVPLRDLSALTLERLYNQLRESGGKNGRPLSAKTVRHAAGMVHSALQTAVRWKLLRYNPADGVILPTVEQTEARALDAAETECLLRTVAGHWLYPFLVVAVATGARRGELLALTWADVDFLNAMLIVSKSLEQTKAGGLRVKSTKGRRPRRLKLPPAAVEVLTMLRQEQDVNRAMFEDAYRADLDLVFCTPDGDYWKPDSITAKVCVVAQKAGLRGVSLHSLRHSHASQLLSGGVALPTVSKRLGHSSPHITAQIYSHALSQDEEAAADIWQQKMGVTITGSQNVQ
jgi:integrase